MKETLILALLRTLYNLYLRGVLLQIVQETPNKLDDRIIPALDVLLGREEG